MGIKNIKINVSLTNFMFHIMKIFVVLQPKNYTQGNIVSKKGIKLT